MSGETTPGVRKVSYEPAEPIDVVAVAGAPLAKRAVPIAVGLALLVLVIALIRRRT